MLGFITRLALSIMGLGALSAAAITAAANNQAYAAQSGKTISNHFRQPCVYSAHNFGPAMAGGFKKINLQNPGSGKPKQYYNKAGQKYSLENGVRVYRGPVSYISGHNNRNISQNNARIIYGMKIDRQRKTKALRKRLARAKRAAYERGFEAGFEKGFARAHKKYKRRNIRRSRYNYGRRYSTSFYGYPLSRRYTFGPYLTGSYRPFR